ncbi:MAG: PHP domain-containing protein [Deltaproteobacteria bacterium]|nr:PHP domain-containing protein [Deltaproteobacteria bacterium]
MDGFVDLHTHSAASDGTDRPAELVALAAAASLTAVALTDHDTVSGLDEAAAAGRRHGIGVVRGCEVAVSSPYGEMHILGLWLPEAPVGLAAALEKIRIARDARNREMVERFRRAGFDVSYPELLAVAAGESVGRPHMARLLVQKGVCSTTRDAFARFLADGKAMHVPRALPAPAEGLAMLQAENATTVLAHPMLLKAPFPELEKMVGQLAALGLDGIEVWHSEQDAAATRRAKMLAQRFGLAPSGGSDYHGAVRPDVTLGRVWQGGRVPAAVMEALLERRARRGRPV